MKKKGNFLFYFSSPHQQQQHRKYRRSEYIFALGMIVYTHAVKIFHNFCSYLEYYWFFVRIVLHNPQFYITLFISLCCLAWWYGSMIRYVFGLAWLGSTRLGCWADYMYTEPTVMYTKRRRDGISPANAILPYIQCGREKRGLFLWGYFIAFILLCNIKIYIYIRWWCVYTWIFCIYTHRFHFIRYTFTLCYVMLYSPYHISPVILYRVLYSIVYRRTYAYISQHHIQHVVVLLSSSSL